MKQPVIAVIGSLNMDYVFTAQRLPIIGETVAGETFRVLPGGKGANQAVQAARFGAHTYMIGRVGQDDAGRVMLDTLQGAGVRTEYVIQEETAPTAAVCIRVDGEGRNDIIITAGANGRCSPGDIDRAEPVLRRADLILLQNEIPQETNDYALRQAERFGVPVLYNPAPARAADGEMLRRAAFFTPNETEARFYTGTPVGAENARESARKLLRLGARAVILTLGADGAYYADENAGIHVPALRIRPKDTTAAGDAFNAAFAVGTAMGKGLEEALRFGCAAGAYAAMHEGAIPSLGTLAQVEALLQSARTDA